MRAYTTVGTTKVYSNYSALVNAKPILSVPGSVTAISSSTSSINVKWSAVSGANGYEVYSSTSSTGTYTLKSTTTATSYNNTGLTTNSAYYYKVRAYTMVGTTKVYSNYSTVVSLTMIKGIDVSKWKGTIDWSLVKSDGVKFALLRSSYGDGTDGYINNGVDPTFETNYAAAKANGIAVGAFHYSYATTLDQATTEAKFLISRLQGKQFEYPICIDIEDVSQETLGKTTLANIALIYLNMLKQAGYYPIIYSNSYGFTDMMDDTMLTSYDHWLAQPKASITYPGQVGIWQYSLTGTVNGIAGDVDMDISFVDYESKIKSLHLNGF